MKWPEYEDIREKVARFRRVPASRKAYLLGALLGVTIGFVDGLVSQMISTEKGKGLIEPFLIIASSTAVGGFVFSLLCWAVTLLGLAVYKATIFLVRAGRRRCNSRPLSQTMKRGDC